MKICDALYGKLHHKNNKANAFRHTLWNILICKEGLKVSEDEEKAITWAKKITDLHEKLMPNKPLEKLMDLKNNEAGRGFFKEIKEFSEEKIISFLKEKAAEAQKIDEDSEVVTLKNKLVYID